MVPVGEGMVVVYDGFAVINRAEFLFSLGIVQVFSAGRTDRVVAAVVVGSQHDALRSGIGLVKERIVLPRSREIGVTLGVSPWHGP